MGTKLNPGKFDCHDKALPDEPVFTLLARDIHAPALIEQWAVARMRDIALRLRPTSDIAMVDEAQACANRMREWRKQNNGNWRTGPETVQVPARYHPPKILSDALDRLLTPPPPEPTTIAKGGVPRANVITLHEND